MTLEEIKNKLIFIRVNTCYGDQKQIADLSKVSKSVVSRYLKYAEDMEIKRELALRIIEASNIIMQSNSYSKYSIVIRLIDKYWKFDDNGNCISTLQDKNNLLNLLTTGDSLSP